MTQAASRKTIGLIVPSILDDGGVPAVARFIKNCVRRSGEFDLRIVSLATSSRDACSVRLGSPRSWPPGVRSIDGRWDGEPYTHVGAFLAEFEFQRFRPRATLADRLRACDVIQVVAGCPAWALPACGLGKPVALQVATRARVERRRVERVRHGPLARWRRIMTRITDRLDDRALASVDAVLVENPWMQEYVDRIPGRADRIVKYGPPGVDLDRFHPDPSRDPADPSSRCVLAVGRFDDPRKNVELLVEAFSILAGRLQQPPRLILAGASDPGPGFWSRVAALGLRSIVSFHHRPPTDELVRLLQRATCLALPSDEEGFGVVVIEAMACGIPVVSTRCGGPEGTISEGADGFLVPLGDAAAFAERLQRLCENRELNMRMGLAARRTAETRFGEDVAGAAFLDTYRVLAARRRGP